MNPDNKKPEIRFEIFMHGALKDYFSEKTEIVAPSTPAPTLETLFARLIERNPEAASLLGHCRWGVDHHIVAATTTPAEGARIDLLPPSSGG